MNTPGPRAGSPRLAVLPGRCRAPGEGRGPPLSASLAGRRERGPSRRGWGRGMWGSTHSQRAARPGLFDFLLCRLPSVTVLVLKRRGRRAEWDRQMRLIQEQAAFDVSTGSEASVPTATKTPPCFTIISKTENYVSSLSSMAMPDLTYSGEIGVWILRFISVYFGSGSDVCALTRILYTPRLQFLAGICGLLSEYCPGSARMVVVFQGVRGS